MSDVTDPLSHRAFLETTVQCDNCKKTFADPDHADCVSEDAVDAWANRIAAEARAAGWSIQPDWRILCPECFATLPTTETNVA